MTKRLRFLIFERDDFTCQYCGRKPPEVILEIDHKIPRDQKGKDEEPNLITSCRDCNRGKRNYLVVKPSKEVIILEEEREKQRKALERFYKKEKTRINREIKLIKNYWDTSTSYSFSEHGEKSIEKFLKTFLVEEIKKAISIATIKLQPKTQPEAEQKFKYMCGILHNWKKEKECPGILQIIRYWETRKRGSGYYKENILKEALLKYPIEKIKEMMDSAIAHPTSSYFRTFCQIAKIDYDK